ARKVDHCRRIKRIRGATRSVNHGRCIRRRTIQIGGRITTARRATHRGAAIPVVWWLTLRAASAEFFHGLPLSPCQDRGRGSFFDHQDLCTSPTRATKRYANPPKYITLGLLCQPLIPLKSLVLQVPYCK